jgi:hypothetical protein
MIFQKEIQSCIGVMLLLITSTCAADTKTVYIDIIGEGKFEVVYHRALTNATGALIAGLIGAGIQSGIESDRDSRKRDELQPLINRDSWKTEFLDTLNDKLESSGFDAVWVENTKDIDDGIVLSIYPDQYGFRMVDTSTQMVSAFTAFKASISSRSTIKNKKQEKEKFYITNKNQHPYHVLLMEDSPVNSELEAVLIKAAKRLANKIIYSTKE